MEKNHEEKDVCSATTTLQAHPKSLLFEMNEVVVFSDQRIGLSTKTSFKYQNLQS